VLVDTCVWSLALRRHQPSHGTVGQLERLIRETRAEIIGPVRQEVLSGIPDKKQFERLRSVLASFKDIPLERDDFEQAAAFFNQCRARGVQGSNTDFLICSVAHRHRLDIFSTDDDFRLYAKHLPIRLHSF
jgi:predicted nucleic acid-binding protein